MFANIFRIKQQNEFPISSVTMVTNKRRKLKLSSQSDSVTSMAGGSGSDRPVLVQLRTRSSSIRTHVFWFRFGPRSRLVLLGPVKLERVPQSLNRDVDRLGSVSVVRNQNTSAGRRIRTEIRITEHHRTRGFICFRQTGSLSHFQISRLCVF